MKFLIIDNHSKHIREIVKLFHGLEVEVIDVLDLDKIDFSLYDAFILSGSSKYSVVSNVDIYSLEIELIKKSDKPILGICLGFELICYAFDEMLEFYKKRLEGNFEVDIILEDKLLEGISSPLTVYGAHKWTISKTNFLKVLATSNSGIEILKHPEKLIYGLQFHPEAKKYKQQKIIDNFVGIVENKNFTL